MSYGITPWDVSGNVMNLNPIGAQNSFKQNWVVHQSGVKKPNGAGDDLAFVPDHDAHDVSSWMDIAAIQIPSSSLKQMKQKFNYEGALEVIPSHTGFDTRHSQLEQELEKDDDLGAFFSQHQSENVQNVSVGIEDELETWLQYTVVDPSDNNNANNTNNSSNVTSGSGTNNAAVDGNHSSGNGNGNADLLCRDNSSSGNPASALPIQNSRTANADVYLALGAQRAAGVIPQSAGSDAFNRVRATTLPTITTTSIHKWAPVTKCKTLPSDPDPNAAKADSRVVQKPASNAFSEQQPLSHPRAVSGCGTKLMGSERLVTGADRHQLMTETAIPFPPSGACPQDKPKVMQKGDFPQKHSLPSSTPASSLPLNFPQFSRPVALYSRPNLQQFENTFNQMGNPDLLNVSKDNNSSESSLTESTPVDVTCSYPDPLSSQPLTSPSVIQSVVKASHDFPLPDNAAQQLQYRDQQQFLNHQQVSGQTASVPQRLDTRSIPLNGGTSSSRYHSGVQDPFQHSAQSSRPCPQQNTKISEVNTTKNDSHFSGSAALLRDALTNHSNQLGVDHLQSQNYPDLSGSARNSGIPYHRNHPDAVFQDGEQWSHYTQSFQGLDNDRNKIRDYSLYAQKMALMNWDRSNNDITDSVSLLPSMGASRKDECENSFHQGKAVSSPSAVQSDECLVSTKSERNLPSPNEAVDNKGMENKRVESSGINPTKTKRAREEDVTNGAVSTSQVEGSPENKATRAAMDAASKRSRAAEVHNLSERRRRDRINEKMKELQNLIPNSNKTDKASMLDEAIEYLKMLQQQLQVMAMKSETDNQKWQALQAMYSNHLYSYGDMISPLSCLGPMQMQTPPMHMMPPVHHPQFGNPNWQLHPPFPVPPHSVNPLLSAGMPSPLHSGMMKTGMTSEGLSRASEMSSGGVSGTRSAGMESFPEAFVPGPNNVLNSRADPIRNLPSIQPSLRSAALPLSDPDILRSLRMHPNPAYHLGRGGNPIQEASVSGLKPQGLPNQRRPSGNFPPLSAASESLNSDGFRNDPSAKRMNPNGMDSSSILQASSCWNSVSTSDPHMSNGPAVPLSLPRSAGSASAFPSMDSSFLPSNGVIKSEIASHGFLYPESRSNMFDYSKDLASGFNASRVDASDLIPMAPRYQNSSSKPVEYVSDMRFPSMGKTMDDVSRNF